MKLSMEQLMIKNGLVIHLLLKIKRPESKTFEEYKPQQVKSIRIDDGDYYESYLIKIDNTPAEFEGALFDSSLISSVEKHAFLLVQFSTAGLSLYSYRSKNQLRFYLKKGNEVPQELIYRKYTVRKANGIFEMEDNNYMNQLDFLAENCSEVDKKLMSLPYKLTDIIDLLKSYYKSCSKTTDTYLRIQPENGRFSASIIAGLSKTDLAFKGDNPNAVYVAVITRTPLKTKTTFSPGIRFNYLIPRLRHKLSFLLDMYYNQFTASTSEYTYNRASDDYETKFLSISPAYLHTSFGIKYCLNKENKIRPFLQVGISESLMLSEKSEAIWDKHYFGTNTITSEYPFPNNSLKKSSFGEFFGVGLSYKKWGIDFCYHNMGSLARYVFIKSPVHATTLFISYQITR